MAESCTCPSLTERCPHCGRLAGQEHKDRCHRAAVGGADVEGLSFAEACRLGVIPMRAARPDFMNLAMLSDLDAREGRQHIEPRPVTLAPMDPGDVAEGR